jgi:hypothetical protein
MSERDVCDNCGSETFSEGHFAVGKLWCRECWSGRTPAKAMPPSPVYKKQIEAWCAPRVPAAPRTPRPGEMVQPEGVQRG